MDSLAYKKSSYGVLTAGLEHLNRDGLGRVTPRCDLHGKKERAVGTHN